MALFSRKSAPSLSVQLADKANKLRDEQVKQAAAKQSYLEASAEAHVASVTARNHADAVEVAVETLKAAGVEL